MPHKNTRNIQILWINLSFHYIFESVCLLAQLEKEKDFSFVRLVDEATYNIYFESECLSTELKKYIYSHICCPLTVVHSTTKESKLQQNDNESSYRLA